MPLPTIQYAIQLVGPGSLEINASKPVPTPGPHQILARVECVGLCFSDLKLLDQFSRHARKSRIVSGLDPAVLADIPSYVPDGKATVPGHEVACRIVAVGDMVKHHKVGERCLVQSDYRDLPTANSNAAFGYNFEGALQEYILLDERIVIDQAGERFLMPAPENLSASSIALVEPWACVENSYVNPERTTLLAGGKLLVVTDPGLQPHGLDSLLKKQTPASVTTIHAADAATVPDEGFDDIIYFGSDKTTIDILNDKLAARGLINIVLGGKKIGKPASVSIGRVHYGMTRWIGTHSSDPADSYKYIPATGELRPGDKLLIIGAGGPMGQMHVIRAVCQGVPNLSVVGTDNQDSRLDAILKKARPFADANKISLRMVNATKQPLTEKFSYIALMAPVGALVADAVRNSVPGSIINIFAGLPSPTRQEIDLDTYITNRCYMFGTSGSVIRDMKIVLQKVVSHKLDTDRSVDAVSGMAGARDGIAAVKNRSLAGKIVVYPELHDLGLTPLSDLEKLYPTVAAKLDDGAWTRAAEQELLRVAAQF